jgi:hypothetical protein
MITMMETDYPLNNQYLHLLHPQSRWMSCKSCTLYWKPRNLFFGLAYQGKDIVFRFIIEYSSLMDFGP